MIIKKLVLAVQQRLLHQLAVYKMGMIFMYSIVKQKWALSQDNYMMNFVAFNLVIKKHRKTGLSK
ncbi:hypothetical protein MCOL2_20743 [Listeria fleischmannii FSL S10-1203]|uniref:Uncharacterized protein n=1 Tax=Listeria fleischmannii FSL S10-1203 TaxID=1265822 RepID=W7CU71_9LIST|nr:hypothetical protein MCOL2_20743 [Listeria fleischmannii FSL S10-1203]